MALQKCEECNEQISTRATICPHCGYPRVKPEQAGCVEIISKWSAIAWGIIAAPWAFFTFTGVASTVAAAHDMSAVQATQLFSEATVTLLALAVMTLVCIMGVLVFRHR
jgi:RNA polymerase subunit RPABC4/transcription elongation factor Spt4